MGYLDNTSVTVDAILTNKGRELLAKGDGSFNITQFALADDEIDYDLWNPNHSLGSDYYGIIIENMPLTEAIPDETQAMKSRLLTLDNNTTTRIPTVQVDKSSITLNTGQSAIIQASTFGLNKFEPSTKNDDLPCGTTSGNSWTWNIVLVGESS